MAIYNHKRYLYLKTSAIRNKNVTKNRDAMTSMNTTRNKKVVILGANGLLGHELLNNYFTSDWDISGHFGRSKETNGDLSILSETISYLDSVQPEVIINLVALTNVDYCETNPNESYLINVKVVENIVAWIALQECRVHLVHISTDQVYDGEGLHSEDKPALTNYYAFSKYAGELAAATRYTTILRTNFFGKSKAKSRVSFTDWLYHALINKEKIQVFDDVYFSPLAMSSLSKMIALIIRKEVTGSYNLGSRQGLSKADFAFEFAEALGLDAGYMTRAKIADIDFVKTYRPKDMRLDVNKFEQTLKVVLPTLQQEILKVSKEYT